MFTEKIVNLLNDLVSNQYELSVKTVKDIDRTMEIEAVSFNKKTYKIVIDERGMNKKGEDATVIMQLKALTDKEALERHLNIISTTKIYTLIEHKYSDKIYLKYEVFKDKGEEEDFKEDIPIETGIEPLEDSKEILTIVRKYFKDYEMHLKIEAEE